MNAAVMDELPRGNEGMRNVVNNTRAEMVYIAEEATERCDCHKFWLSQV